MGRKKPLFFALSAIILVVLGCLYFTPSLGQALFGGKKDPLFLADGRLHVLLMGEDDGFIAPGKQSRGRSDTLILATFDPESGQLDLLSVPRDTRVAIPGRKYKERINHAYAYGGVDLTLETVRQFIGIPVRHYALIDTGSFRDLVDAIGGVPIDVEKDMKYTDKAGGLYIDLKAGYQVLNGEQAEGYVRYRRSDSDVARTGRQQKFIIAAIKQAAKPTNLLKIGKLFRMATAAIDSNIPKAQAARYLPALKKLSGESITHSTLPGKDNWLNGTFYYEADKKVLAALKEDFYGRIDREANENVEVVLAFSSKTESYAGRMTALLKNYGFKVKQVKQEATLDPEITSITAPKSQAASAALAAEAVALPQALTLGGAEDEEITVHLGTDILP